MESIGLSLRREANVLLDELVKPLPQGLDARTVFLQWRAKHGAVKAPLLFNSNRGRTLASLDNDLRLRSLPLGWRIRAMVPTVVNLSGTGCQRGVVLRCEEDGPVRGKSVFKRPNGPRATDLESDLSEREDHDIADRHHRQPGDVMRGTIRVFFHKQKSIKDGRKPR